jgi:hypothetical protein
MSTKNLGHKMLPNSVRLSIEEAELLRQISEAELISEAALMRKFVLEGLWRYRLDQTIKRDQEWELDLSSAAQVAGLAIREFMRELHRRGADIYGPEQRLMEGIGALAEVFGASEALRRSMWLHHERGRPAASPAEAHGFRLQPLSSPQAALQALHRCLYLGLKSAVAREPLARLVQ